MAKTERVMSGSRTKGSTATPSGSIIYSYQGINARTNASYWGSLLPRIGSGNRLDLYKGSKRLSEKEFDDSLVINNDTSDMRGISGSIITTRIGFDLERMTFGQAPTTQRGEPFADISGFDPVAYLDDPGHTMWPANLWNAGSLPDYEFDGTIEVFDIRTEILGLVNLKYEGRAPRGSVTGPFSENQFGSTEITGEWKKSDKHQTAFLDGPLEISRNRADAVPVLAKIQMQDSQPWQDDESAVPLQGYQGLERELLNPFVSQDYHDVIYSEVKNHNLPLTFMSQSAYDLNVGWSAASYRYDAYPNLVAWFRLNEVGSPLSDVIAQDSGPLNFTGSISAGCTNFTSPLPTGFTAQSSVFDFPDPGGDAVTITGGNAGSGKTWDDLVGGYYDATESKNYLKSFTVCAWVRNGNDNGPVLNIGARDSSTGGGGIRIFSYSFERVAFSRIGPSSISKIQVDNAAPDFTWFHIACVANYHGYDESETPDSYMSIYIDGVKKTPDAVYYSPTRLRAATITDNAARIGKDNGDTASNDRFEGQIADVSIFDRALSSDEINAIYNATLGGPGRVVVQQDPLQTALEDLNKASCERLTDPLEKRGTRGFYFGQKAGSIVYGDW